MYIYYQLKYRWIANQQGHRKNQFADEPEGLQQFQDHHWKALGEENPDPSGLFLCDHLLTSCFLYTSEKRILTKRVRAESDSSCQIL